MLQCFTSGIQPPKLRFEIWVRVLNCKFVAQNKTCPLLRCSFVSWRSYSLSLSLVVCHYKRSGGTQLSINECNLFFHFLDNQSRHVTLRGNLALHMAVSCACVRHPLCSGHGSGGSWYLQSRPTSLCRKYLWLILRLVLIREEIRL